MNPISSLFDMLTIADWNLLKKKRLGALAFKRFNNVGFAGNFGVYFSFIEFRKYCSDLFLKQYEFVGRQTQTFVIE